MIVETGPFSWETRRDKYGDIEVMVEACPCEYPEIQSFWINRADSLVMVRHLISLFDMSDEELKGDPPV